MAYIQRFNDETIQVDDYIDQVALQAVINGLQLSSFKWEMFKKMPKTLSGLIEEAKRHTIAEALYYTEDTRSGKEVA